MQGSYLAEKDTNRQIRQKLADFAFETNANIGDFLKELVRLYQFDRVQIFLENMELPTYFAGRENITFCDCTYGNEKFYETLWMQQDDILIIDDTKTLREKEPRLYEAYTKRHIISAIQYVILGDAEEVIGMISLENCRNQEQPLSRNREIFAFVCEVLAKACKKVYDHPNTDRLTSLADRKWVKQCIETYISSTHGTGALLVVDVDNFLKINEELGHVFGNQVLVSIAKIIKNTFRNSDIIGRIGGDEFLVFIKEVEERESVIQKANMVTRDIRKIFMGETRDTQISASIGIAFYPQDGTNCHILRANAESALRYIKRERGTGIGIYDKNIHQENDKTEVKENHESYLQLTESEERFERFYCEFMELTFRLLEETNNADSAIHLLLYKLKEYFGFSATIIQEIIEVPRTLRCRYENCNEKFTMKRGMDITYSESEWATLYTVLKQKGYYICNPEKVKRGEELDLYQGNAVNIKSAIKIPLMNNNCFIGVVEFVDVEVEHEWTERDIQFLKSFCHVISVYLSRIQAYDDAYIMMKKMNEHDDLTGLYKYETFKQRMEVIKAGLREGQKIAYVYSDISHFKHINETYGYQAGNEILRRFAWEVTNNNPYFLCASRVHSDNVLLVVNDELSAEAIQNKVNELNLRLGQELRREYKENAFVINSGLYITDDPSTSVEEDVYNANYARKQAKRAGDGKCVLFTDQLMEKYRRELKYIAELPGAIENKELTVYIQPKVDGATHKVLGGEALIRWKKSDGTFIYPDEFIPVFERTGDIVQLDYYVYKEVFAYLKKKLDEGQKVVPISMNVSRVHLDNMDFICYIEGLLEEYQLDTNLIEFELTESIYLDNMENLMKLMDWFRKKSLRTSMDDFGTGYSSLNILGRLPIDVLKLDRIFLNNEDILENNKVILSNIICMAKQLNMTVVCEGVETEEQSKFLGMIECDMLQGYYFGRPMSMSDFDRYLQEHV